MYRAAGILGRETIAGAIHVASAVGPVCPAAVRALVEVHERPWPRVGIVFEVVILQI